MDSRTRFLNALDFKKVDRIPVVPQLTYAAAKWIGITIDQALNDGDKQLKALINAQEQCNHDAIYAGWEGSFTLLTTALGAKEQIFKDKPPNVDNPIVIEKPDLEKIKPLNPKKAGRIPINLKLIKDLKQKTEVPILSYIPAPLTLSGLLHGTDKIMLAIYTNLDFLRELIEVSYNLTHEFALAKIEAGIDSITIADPTGSSDMISPKHFEQISFPTLQKLVHELKKEGIKVGLHICGNTKPILSLMAKTGADYLEIDQVVALNEAREILKSTCIIGNISTSELLSGNENHITRLANDCIEKAGSTGYILSSGCEVPYGTPIENIQTMVKTVIEKSK
ncbi:MAG: uroporphyrinogen decarboxylase family protein [Candidatus Helarchaeota archaeon]